MYKRLVVGYDGRTRSHEAVNAAAELARALSASLHIVTAVAKDRLRDLDGGPERRAIDVEEAQAGLDRLISELDDVNVTKSATKGSPADVLLAETAKIGADLIVVGNRNVQGVGRVAGSIAEQVMRKAPCDVLVVNTKQPAQS